MGMPMPGKLSRSDVQTIYETAARRARERPAADWPRLDGHKPGRGPGRGRSRRPRAALLIAGIAVAGAGYGVLAAVSGGPGLPRLRAALEVPPAPARAPEASVALTPDPAPLADASPADAPSADTAATADPAPPPAPVPPWARAEAPAEAEAGPASPASGRAVSAEPTAEADAENAAVARDGADRGREPPAPAPAPDAAADGIPGPRPSPRETPAPAPADTAEAAPEFPRPPRKPSPPAVEKPATVILPATAPKDLAGPIPASTGPGAPMPGAVRTGDGPRPRPDAESVAALHPPAETGPRAGAAPAAAAPGAEGSFALGTLAPASADHGPQALDPAAGPAATRVTQRETGGEGGGLAAAAPGKRERHWYAGGQVNTSLHARDDFGGGSIDIMAELEKGAGANVFAGYRSRFGTRLEAEWFYRHQNYDRMEIGQDAGAGTFLGLGDLDGTDADGRGALSMMGMMANIYQDIPVTARIRPYVGGGIGIARVNVDDAGIPQASLFDGHDDVFAYQVGGGIAFSLTESLDLFVDYRYFATGDYDVTYTTGDKAQGSFTSHNIGIGLRVGF